MEQIIGGYKEFVVIERELLNELLKESKEYSNSKGLFAKGIGEGMERTIERIKENNIYNKEFEIKK
jgi:hypothetical protein